MNIALPILFLVFSTLFGAVIARPLLARLTSAPLIIAISWFTGQYISAFIVYHLSIALVSLGHSGALFTSCVIVSSVSTVVGILFFRSPIISRLRSTVFQIRVNGSLADSIAYLAAFLFAFYFFQSQLRTDAGVIKHAAVYWDFPVHAPIIQGFVLGDNFPAQNNSLSGVPLTYHFFCDFLISMYAALGLDLVAGVNAVTTIGLGFLLITAFGLAIEFFKSRAAGYVAMALVPTSASLRFIHDILVIKKHSLSHWLSSLSGHPYHTALLSENPGGYNGNMFNIFYFLAERQMIFAAIFLLISLAALYHRRSLSVTSSLIIGVAAGAFVHWHLFVTISVLMMVGCLLVCGAHRVASLLILLSMSCVVGLQVFEMRELTQTSLFFPDIRDYPKFNPFFPTMEPLDSNGGYPLTPRNFFWYYLFGYGLKFFLIPWGLLRLWKQDRDLALIILALFVPTFIAINTVQLSPLSIYDNHKWLRPLNVALDVLVASVLAGLLAKPKHITRTAIGLGAVVVCVASGTVELVPYLLPIKGTNREGIYAPRHTPLTDMLEAKTPPQSNFLTGSALEVHLAGRRTFTSNPHDEPGATNMAASFRINEGQRQAVRAQIYNAIDPRDLCEAARANDLDYIERSESSPDIIACPVGASWPFISATNRRGESVSFLDVHAVCDRAETVARGFRPTEKILPALSDKQKREAISISSLTPSFEKASFAKPQINKNFLGLPISLAGTRYDNGLGLHAPIILKYAVPEGFSHLRGIVGIDDDVVGCNGHSVVFRIQDETGRVLFNSGLLASPQDPKRFEVDVAGKGEITLVVTDSGDGIDCDHVNLADTFFIKTEAA